MLVNKENIQVLIPQRPPFVMIDELHAASEKGFKSQFTIDDTNIFVEDGLLSESAIIENIAQTCAAGFGYVGQQNGEGAGKIGFIGAVSRLTREGEIETGDIITTEVEILNTFDNIHLAQGTAKNNKGFTLSCQLKIVLA